MRQVRSKFRRTPLGDLPEEWDLITVKDACPKIVDHRGRTPKKLGMDWGGGDVPALSARNVKSGYIDLHEETNFGSEALYRRWMTRGEPEKGDVVITTEAPLGNAALIPDTGKYILSQRTVLLGPDQNLITSAFLLQFVLGAAFQRTLAERATGSTAQGIQRRQLEKLTIARPPLPEQRAIGRMLGDLDHLLKSLADLVVKKKAIKTAAMQQLVTGRKRLPGWTGEWSTKLLGEIAAITMGHSPDSRYYNERGRGIPLIQGNADIRDGVTMSRIWTTHAPRTCESGALLLTVRAPVGAVAVASSYSCLGRGVASVRPTHVGSDFLRHALVLGQSRWQSLEQGSTFTAANRVHIEKFAVFVPPTLEEQAAIASVLSDMDSDLTALERRLQKSIAIRRAAAQALLSGRMRLAGDSDGMRYP
jgi:type I restriction enzyme, S subunit